MLSKAATQPKSRCIYGYKSLTCAGVRARVSGGLLYHRSSSKKVPSLSSSPLISSHVCAGEGTVELWGSKKWCRTQLEPGPVFPPSKANTWTYKLVVTSSEIRYVTIRGLSSNHFGFGFRSITIRDKHLVAWCLPASKSRWCVGTNTGGDTGGDRGGDGGGATWGGLCWCCKPVLLEVPAWHLQLLQGQKKKTSN